MGEIKVETVKKAYADVDLATTPLLVSWCAGVERAVATYNDLYKNNLANIEQLHKSPEHVKEQNLDNCLLALKDPTVSDYDKKNIEYFYNVYKGYYDMMILKREMMQEFSDEFAKGLQVVGSWEGLLPTEQDAHFTTLIEIAKQIYPFGIEMMNPQQSTSYRSGGLSKAATSGVAHEKKFGLDLKLLDEEQEPIIWMYNRDKTELLANFKNKEEAVEKTGINDITIWRCYMGLTNSVKLNDKQRVAFEKKYKEEQYPSLFVHYIRELQHKLIWKNTRFSMQEFKNELSKPPYGYYDCNLYVYLLGYAMRDLLDGKHKIQIAVVTEPLSESMLAYIISCRFDTIVSFSLRDQNYILRYSDKQNKTIDMLRRMFDIKDGDKTFTWTCIQINQWLQNNVHLGCLDCVNHEMYEVLMASDRTKFEDNKSFEDILYPLLKANYKQIKAAVRSIDDITEKELVADFGQEIIAKYKAYVSKAYNTSHARSWVWSKQTLWEEVRSIAEHHQCADCGKLIKYGESIDTFVCECGIGYDPNKQVKNLVFSEKDIVGINRKLLGEDTTKFYCIPCLCDVVECTPQELMDKIEQFKEEGCTLFQ